MLAARLTEDEDVKVVVLEAGEEETKYPDHYIPLMLFFLQNTEADWAYRTVPQKKACLGLNEQVGRNYHLIVLVENVLVFL